jgi:4-hydroxyphenylpyruvate dioxygenase-like putative hemolysin
MINKVDHLTMVVKDLDAALKSFGDMLHLTPEQRSYVGETAARRLAMLPTKGGARIELIQPKPGGKNRFSQFLKEHGEGVVGLSIFCTNFDEEIANLKQNGIPISL